MAKKSIEKTDFKGLMNKIQAINPYASIVSEDETMKISNWVSTGHYELNAQITGSIYKGIPEGRLLVYAGDPGTGKTFLALNSSREAQRQFNSHIFWFDSEGAMDTETMERIGIDTSKVTLIPVETIRETAQIMLTILGEISGNEPIEAMFVLDSIGNLSSDKETEDLLSGNNKRDMTKQQELKAMFRTILTRMRKKRVPMIATTHVYESIGSYIPTKNVSGGSGAKYGAGIIIMLSTKNLKIEDDTDVDENKLKNINSDIKKTGVMIVSKQEKARYTKAGIPVTLYVSFHKGMNKYIGLHRFLDWETCRVGPGKLVEEVIEQEVNGKIKKVKTGKMIYEPHTGAQAARKWVVDDMEIPKADFWKYSKIIFNKERLDIIDKKLQELYCFQDFEDEYEKIEAEIDKEIEAMEQEKDQEIDSSYEEDSPMIKHFRED